jgi:hypothetical protein
MNIIDQLMIIFPPYFFFPFSQLGRVKREEKKVPHVHTRKKKKTNNNKRLVTTKPIVTVKIRYF